MSSSRVEGLIPFIYKAIKDHRRSSSRAAYRDAEAEDAVDLGDTDQRRRWLEQELRSPLRAAAAAPASTQRHGRNRSLEELAGQVGLSPGRRLPLPKARSVRAFACIGAGAA
ncbi:hypothetical protein D1007_02061 [Hordeum vulgare]|uniref:Predicted protein n=1 Tax=Hordeum vulgare subsp. vulgare TaxID=112509 RepID=F2CUG9_HORVV|nr:uncharacterized protein LOC123412893 [Hordeum vulgare subsp. vulgare]KAE8820091.1 hypothetical protein D1007_02061 [Hordeum vulgare]KAI5018590.1 hypothetical protein ZWY2020_043478 [Hordeum vulgare]BAJ86490.1 predicted protein [Hordeum vulgare subsp. vulgare]